MLPPGDRGRSHEGSFDTGHQFGHGRAETDDHHPDDQSADARLLGQRDRAAHQQFAAENKRDQTEDGE